MNRDFVEMLAALSAAEAEFLVVGAYALAVHGRPRATGDLDLWVRPTAQNASRVWAALTRFGAPLDRLEPKDLETPDVVFQIGLPPSRIDVPVIGRDTLIRNKLAAARPRDLADVAELRNLPGS